MVAQMATRRKAAETYRYGWYRCGFARSKGPAVCSHATGYRRERLEAALLAKFREAMSPAMVADLAHAINAEIEVAFRSHDARTACLTAEVCRIEGQAQHLVRFLATGGDSPAVRAELRVLESTLEPLRAELTAIERASTVAPPRVHPAWVIAKLEQLDALTRQNPVRAKMEIMKHLDGDLAISPLPSQAGERRAEIRGAVKPNSLLADQEAVCLQVVAGAGFEPATFGL